MSAPEDVLSFWLDEVSPKDWYQQSDAVDAQIADRFGPVWEEAICGGLGLWLTHPSGTLAYLILTDQFSRNLHRGAAEAFALDSAARAVAKVALSRDWDLRIDPPARQFFYLPLMHSENLCDQERCVRLFATRMPDAPDSLLHAQAHRDVIRDFGRFPFRNAALGRRPTAAESAWMAAGGYGAVVRALQTEAHTAA